MAENTSCPFRALVREEVQKAIREAAQAPMAGECSESSAVEDYDGGNGTQATENEQWLELARMLPEYVYVDEEDSSIVICHPESALEDYCDGVYSPIMRAMLIGLACEEAVGSVEVDLDGLWSWSTNKGPWGAGESSRPAAAIAMLKAYREGEQ